MKVLFCTDGSEISLYAFENATKYLKDAIIDPVCVIDWSFLPTEMNIDTSGYANVYEKVADDILNTAVKLIECKGFALGEKIKNVGSAVEGILEQVEHNDYDLIILGSHGKKGIQKWLGSVSRQIVSNSILPVFISKKPSKGQKILITVDGSQQSSNAVKTALNLLNLNDKEIFIISVKESPELLPVEATLDKNWLESIEKQQKVHATKAINVAKALIEKEDIKVHNEIILTGHPAQKIIEFVEKEKIDLVIMGSRTKTDLSKLLLGSVSKRVLEHVDSDVLIINK